MIRTHKPDVDLCFFSASALLGLFRTKELSPAELMTRLIDRHGEVNQHINATTETYFDRALDSARKAEAAYVKNPGDCRPLEGLPVAIKDFHPVAGELTTFGSHTFGDFRPEQTAPTVQRLFDAGAIMHIRTTTPEFAYSGMCHSPRWGVTRNPWNTDFTPGGSSGGSAAAVAAGITPLADGTDGGGSVRIPAGACGLVGFKPPFGRNPLDQDHVGEAILKYGPLTRTVADAALMQNVMSGWHIDDRYTIQEKVVVPTESQADIKGLKIAYSSNLGYLEIDPVVSKNTQSSVAVFEALGCSVVEEEIDWNWGNLTNWLTYWEGLFAGVAGHLLKDWRFHMDPVVVGLLERGLQHSAATLYQAYLYRNSMYQRIKPIFEKYDLLICPTNCVPAVPVDHDELSGDFKINGREVHATYGWFATNPFNLMSQCPVMSMPSGFSPEGVPTGIQLVGRPCDDLTVFKAAAAYENATASERNITPSFEGSGMPTKLNPRHHSI
ncbi:MAG: amidase [Gammaproteobacteria bacterium]